MIQNRLVFFCALAAITAIEPGAFPAFAQKADPEKLKNEGNTLYQKGNLDEAIAKWQAAIGADSTYAFGYNNIGIALYEKKDYRGSAEYLEKTVALDSTYAKAFNSLGNAYLALGDYEKARKAYSSAVRYESRDTTTQTNLGNACLALGDFNGALAAYDKALDIDRNNPLALNNRGLILQAAGKFDDAADSYRQAIRANSEFLDPYINLGALYLSREDPDGKFLQSAIDYFIRAQKMDGHNPVISYNLGLCYLKANNPGRASLVLADLVKMTPNDPKAHYLLGHAYVMSGMIDMAVKSFTEAFTLDRNFTEARIAIDAANQMQKKNAVPNQ